jgi:hypothetical protein
LALEHLVCKLWSILFWKQKDKKSVNPSTGNYLFTNRWFQRYMLLFGNNRLQKVTRMLSLYFHIALFVSLRIVSRTQKFQACYLRLSCTLCCTSAKSLTAVAYTELSSWPHKYSLGQWFPKCGARPPGGAQEILKGGARGAKLFYSQKINRKHKYN